MTSIGEVLQPEHVVLTLAATEKGTAIEEVLAKLNGDDRVKNFDLLREAVLERDAPAIAENGVGICMAHGRVEAVTSLVMAAGRLSEGFRCKDVRDPVRLVFVMGIPSAFNAEYLRIVGAIARICRDAKQLHRLLSVKDPVEFVHLLGAGELKL